MLVTTTKGDMDSEQLLKHEEIIENQNERTRVTEYWHDNELVHRSVHIELKTAIFADSAIGGL